jgi:HEAT repeat protein
MPAVQEDDIAAPGAPAELREAAVHGFLWGYTRSADLALVRHVFENEREAPSVRGQAAEVLGSHFQRYCRPSHRRHARLVSALVRGLDDPSPEVRFWSIYALARPEHTWLLPKLELMAATDTASCPGMWTLRQEALWAIRWITLTDLHCDPRTL